MSKKQLEKAHEDPYVVIAHRVRNDYTVLYRIIRAMKTVLEKDMKEIFDRISDSTARLQEVIDEGRKTFRFIDPAGTFTVRKDAAGDGAFGAPRSGQGGPYTHKGLDTLVEVGDSVRAPIPALFKRKGYCYNGDQSLELVVLVNGKCECKVLYVEPIESKIGSLVRQGEIIGRAQDITTRSDYAKRGMLPHLHTEIRFDGDLKDPSELISMKAASC